MGKLNAKPVARAPSKSKVPPSKRPRTKPYNLGFPSNEELLELAKKYPLPRSFWEGDDDRSRLGLRYVRADVHEAGGRLLGHAILPEIPLDARLLDDGSLLVAGYHQIQLYCPRRPAPWWGCAWLPAFWLIVITGAAFVILTTRDLRRWYRPRMQSP
jgi:hypothetical protein